MPALPWKKSNVTRISRFVSDLRTPKRGGSLVVETGFPTSLVDLFVKNRDRLKKRSSKKKKQPPPIQTEIPDPIIRLIPPSPPHPENPNNLMSLDLRPPNGEEVGNDVETVLVSENRDRVEANCVFAGILKVFVVVVLALSTKKLAVGITMSAFLLIFFEYVGKCMVCVLKPFSDSKSTFKSLIQRVSIFSGSKINMLVLKEIEERENSKVQIVQEDGIEFDSCELVGGVELSSFTEEIQIVDNNLDEILEMRVVEEVEYTDEVMELKTQCSRRAKLKSKIMTKFVPKKFHSKKGKKCREPDSISLVSSCLEEDSSEMCEEQEDVDKGCREKQNFDDGISCSGELVQVHEEKSVDGEVAERRKGNSGYLILVLIVLAGLVRGRILAFGLTIAWCLMSKLVKRPKDTYKLGCDQVCSYNLMLDIC